MPKRLTTKESLAQSALEILKDSRLEDMTVNDIVENCGVSRATFYYHFKDKYDLMEWIYMSKVLECLARFDSLASWREITYEIVELIESMKFYFTVAVDYVGQNSTRDFMTKFGLEYLIGNMNDTKSGQYLSREVEYMLIEWSWGTYYMLEAWIKNDMDLPAESMAQIIIDCAPAKLAVAFDEL